MSCRLYHVSGIRNDALVIAGSPEEARTLAVAAAEENSRDPRVLYGYVGSWEGMPDIDVEEIALPSRYRLVDTEERT